MIDVQDASLATAEAYYRDNYGDYERQSSPAKLEFYMRLVGRWVPAGARVFELGVGQGTFLARAEGTYRVEGVDVNEFGVRQTRGRVPSAGVELGSFERIPSQDPPDAVVAWDVLEHLPDLEAGLRAIHAALPPGGALVAVVPVYDGPLGWLVRRLDHDPTHVSKLGRGDWLTRLSAIGFDVVEHGGILRKLVAGRVYVHIVRPQALLRAAGSALYFVARKPAAR
jgi:SAM-dependent methyltransferase